MAASANPDLSIIILNFNVKDLLLNCLESIFKKKKEEDNWQVIVVDNASVDGSVEAVKERWKACLECSREIATSPSAPRNDGYVLELVENQKNLGFAAGNNIGVLQAKAPVVLFLNPDTIVVDDAIGKSLKFLESNPDIGALTCRVELPDGKLDYSCHRGFPTPWNSFSYFTGLSKLFPKSKLFSGYTATYLDIRKTHEMDCGNGSFLMVRKIAGDQIGWWDKDYFWNGEDIEFFYSLKEKGWKVYFYPEAKIIHFKGSSSGLWNTGKGNVQLATKLNAAKNATSAMRIFYKKHYCQKYPPVLREFVLWSIGLLEQYRKLKIRLGLSYK